MQSIKEAMRSDLVWNCTAIVTAPDDNGNHFRKDGEAINKMMIHCTGKRSHTNLWAWLPGTDANGCGTQMIPAIGTEVMVAFDDGEFEGDAYVVNVYGAALDTSLLDTRLIGQFVEAKSPGGVAAPLATKADLTNLRAAIAGAAVTAGDGGSMLKTNILTALGVAWPLGTQVLKGE